jgi:hypothetical protein
VYHSLTTLFLHRYPNITFDEDLDTFVCPLCKGNCGCTVCTRKRGEEYIGERSYRRNAVSTASAEPKKRRPATAVARKPKILEEEVTGSKGTRMRQKSWKAREEPTPEPKDSEPPNHATTVPKWTANRLQKLDPDMQKRVDCMTNFWGKIYDVEGVLLGKAFVGEDGNDQMVGAQMIKNPAVAPRRPLNKAKRKRPRIFVGMEQERWGVLEGVREIDPAVVLRNKGISALLRPSVMRTYIGKRPRFALPDTNDMSSRSSSPLSSVPDTDVEDGQGEKSGECIEVGMEILSLGDDDVQRAIAAALGALN